MNLDRIERRANAATKGPWGFSYGDRRYIADPSTDIVGEVAPPYSGQTMCVFAVASANQGDSEFIASARTDVPALIARVRKLEERALTAEERLEQMTRERDEARAQLAAHDTGAPCDGHRHCCADRRKLAEELLQVRAERDALKEKP